MLQNIVEQLKVKVDFKPEDATGAAVPNNTSTNLPVVKQPDSSHTHSGREPDSTRAHNGKERDSNHTHGTSTIVTRSRSSRRYSKRVSNDEGSVRSVSFSRRSLPRVIEIISDESDNNEEERPGMNSEIGRAHV